MKKIDTNNYRPSVGLKKEYLWIIKTTMFLLLFTVLSAWSTPSFSQEKKVSLNLKNASLEQVFTEIEKQNDVVFIYRQDLIEKANKVTVFCENANLNDILKSVLAKSQLHYVEKGRQIIITSATPFRAETAPEIKITGKVTDNNGRPMPGTAVIIKGSLKGTTTDENGRYTIETPSNAVLVFSFLGYTKKEMHISGKTEINVVLVTEVAELKEVTINAGYFVVTEKNKTGNISRVDSRSIESQPVSNTLQALQGRMSGVEIIQGTGIPGAGMKIKIRGTNSIRSNGNYPLYLIDGVPVNSTPLQESGHSLFGNTNMGVAGIDPLNIINPSDVESVEVLKDADATAIYGSRGANGVVLITTKKGKPGRTSFDLNVQRGFGKVSKILDVLNTKQYLEMRREALANDGMTPDSWNAVDLLMWDTTRYTNWQKELFGKTSSFTDIQATVSGGNEQTTFLMGGSFRDESTVFPGDFGYKKGTVHFNFSHRSQNQKFRMNLSVNYGIDNNRIFNGNPVEMAVKLAPHNPSLYDNQGNLNWALDEYGMPTFNNPAAGFKCIQTIKGKNLVSNAILSYEILPHLTLKTNLGYTDYRLSETLVNPKSASNPYYVSLGYSKSNTTFQEQTNNSWIVEPQLTYNRIFDNSNLQVLAGISWQDNISDRKMVTALGYISEELLGNLQAADDIYDLQDQESRYKYTALFGRLAYNWKEKYLINLTGRRDGSSRFGPERQFANFGAIGVAWIFTNEDFIKRKLSFLNFGKLRTSYGSSGNDQIGDYAYLDTYSPITGNDRIGGLQPDRLSNLEYRWEVNRKFETALELGFLEDKIRLTTSWYRNRSSNQLVGYALPSVSGFTSIQYNLPATVQNTGWEIELSTLNISRNDFKWTTSINLTIPKNKLLEYPNFEGSPYASVYVIGEPLSIARLYKWQGVNPETGLHQVLDVDGNGTYNQEDQIINKSLDRKFYGGLSNSIQYKNFEMDFLLEFVKQNGNSYLSGFFYPPGFFNAYGAANVPVEALSRWQKNGDVTNVQKYSQSFSNLYPYYYSASSDLNIVDASFIRLKNISLSYRLPIKSLDSKVFVRGQNLITLTNYWGMDPQAPGSGVVMPALKMVTAGLQLKF